MANIKGAASSLNSTGTAATAGRIGEARQAWELVESIRKWWHDRTRWSVSVDSDDRLYALAHRWFTDRTSDEAPPRNLSAVLGERGGLMSSTPGNHKPRPVQLFYDEKVGRELTIGGHRIFVEVNTADVKPIGSDGYRYEREPDTIQFHARSREGQQAVVKLLQGMAESSEIAKPALHMLTGWGDWSRRDDLPERTPESVILAPGQMERLIGDLQQFLDAEPDYNRRAIPYHRGYLLHGSPGTGKTSVVRALAAHFGMDLWYAPLGDLSKDTSLLNLISQVGSHSILLLEDVDVYAAATERDDSGTHVTMTGLLNALDGVATPHGLVTFLTTNNLDALDGAITRAGRADLVEHIAMPDAEQINRMWAHFYDQPIDGGAADKITFNGSAAQVAELFKKHMDDPSTAWDEITRRDL